MLLSTREHYLKHQEELGAMPGPSRIKMTAESMANIKQVMRERDNEATDRATAIFRERLAKGAYRYPPGPQPPPSTASDPTSVVRVTLTHKLPKERIQELLGKFDVYESHKGIVSIDLELTPEAFEAKRTAEVAWEHYAQAKRDYEEYNKWSQGEPSRYDFAEVQLAPGVFEPIQPGEGDGEAVVAAHVPVPPPAPNHRPPTGTVDRLKFDARPSYEKTTIQLGYFPNVTSVAPKAPPTRPTHPDEIEGPWIAHITYDAPDGLEYVKGLNIKSIDGAAVVSIEEGRPEGRAPFAANCPIFQEALRAEEAAEETLMQWPNVPTWKTDYNVWTRRSIAEIVTHNYSNVVDYVDREVLLTGKSVWEVPIDIDYTCGNAKSVPAHAQEPLTLFPKDVADTRKL
jgi:large subunit ribosomal protein L47